MAEDDPQLTIRNRPTAETDFAAWIHHQVAALKAGRFTDLDIDDLSDEVESLAKRDFRKLQAHLQVILMHMLKWDFQPERRDVSWRRSINASRKRVWGELASSPSFKPRLDDAIQQVFSFAREEAWEAFSSCSVNPGYVRIVGMRSCIGPMNCLRTAYP